MEVAGWVIGAGIGTVFTVLYEGVKQLVGRPTQFKAQLEALELTLQSFDREVIHQIGRHNEAMGLPNEDVKALEQELNKGVRIIGQLSDACLWNRIDSRYMSQLVELNRSLNVLERRLKLQSIRDVKETRHMMQILLIRLTLHQEPERHIGHGSLLSTARLLDIAPQEEALDHLLTLDPVRNIASTSTGIDLRQFHGSGEIQEVGSSSDHLPSPLENFNFRGSGDQLQINDGPLVTTSYRMKLIIVLKVFAIDSCSERYKRKAFRVAARIDGVDSSLYDLKTNDFKVYGMDVDVVALVKALRKHVYPVVVVRVNQIEMTESEVSEVKRLHEQQNISSAASGSFLVKICKCFKPTIPW